MREDRSSTAATFFIAGIWCAAALYILVIRPAIAERDAIRRRLAAVESLSHANTNWQHRYEQSLTRETDTEGKSRK
jgi:hypothetical protein